MITNSTLIKFFTIWTKKKCKQSNQKKLAKSKTLRMIQTWINSFIKESLKNKNNQNHSSKQINSRISRAQKPVILKNLKTRGKNKKSCDKLREKREIFNNSNNHKIIKLNFNNHNYNYNHKSNNKIAIILSQQIVATTTKTSNKKAVFLIKTFPNTGIKKNSKQFQILSKILFCQRFRIT